MWTPGKEPGQRPRDIGLDRSERRGVMAALEASHPLIWFDCAGWVLDASAKAVSLLNYNFAPEDRLTYSLLTGMGAGRVDRGTAHWARIASGQLVSEERGLFRSDGTEVWSNLTHAAILNADGSTRRVLTIVIDMSPWSWRPKTDTPLRLT